MTKPGRDKIFAVLSGRDSRRGRRNYAMFSRMFLAGLRESEVCHLTVTVQQVAGERCPGTKRRAAR